MHVPQRSAVLCLVFAEQPLELRHPGAGGEGAGDIERKRVAVEQPLPSNVVANSAPASWARASSALLAPDQVAPRPPMTIGRSAWAIIAMISSTTPGSGRSSCARGIRSVDGM